mgnify:FL=1
MYQLSAEYYDAIYLAMKDYAAETNLLKQIIFAHLQTDGRRLLDIACGTGLHLEQLQTDFQVEGMDISAEMIEVARRRLPGIPLHVGDMANFSLRNTYDVITCLFSSIGYVRTVERLQRAAECMADHLKPGGLLLVEPWFTPDMWHPNTPHIATVDLPDLKIARVNTSMVDGRISILDLHHLVGTPQGTQYFLEHHELGLFTRDEMTDAFLRTGLSVTYEADGIYGRGLYIAQKQKEV